jgi:putative ABC transport system permease protein
MFRKYLLIGFRALRRKPIYTFLNVSGLAMGMAVCMLIGLYVHDELQFDRFHEQTDRIVQIGHESSFWGRSLVTSYPLKETLQQHVPAVKLATHFMPRTHRITNESQEVSDDFTVVYGEPAFFQIFTFNPVAGNPSAALNHPDGIIITESVARRFFGKTNTVGETLLISGEDSSEAVTVLAIVEDPPARSTIQFDMIVSLHRLPAYHRLPDGWGAYMYSTYALLHERIGREILEAQIQQALKPHFENEPPLTFAVPLASVYLSGLHRAEGFRGELKYLYIFGFAALFVLLIAGINYINLATAQGMKRALEVGIRKTLGATRSQLGLQFLIESLLVSSAALVFAFFLVEVALPVFNGFFEKNLALFRHGWVVAGLCVFVFLVGIASGSYPAFFLSRFQPVRAMRGQTHTITAGGNLLRKLLVVLQFFVSFILMIGVSVIYYQLHYIQTKDLGFDGDDVVVVNLHGQEPWRLRHHLRERILRHPGIRNTTVAQAVPGKFRLTLGLKPEELSNQIETEQEIISFMPAVIDHAFIETLGMRLIAGRNFSPDLPTDRARAYMLNETAVRTFGWTPEEAIGKSFGIRDTDGEVIGVVKDFHLTSLHHEIRPVVFQLPEGSGWSASGILAARLDPENVREAIRHIKATLAKFAPGMPFDYRFLDDSFRAMYRTEERLSQIVSSFAILSILIACLGLFGLAAYAAEQRTKEIGIRKVLGATVSNIVVLLSKDFAKLVVIAIVIAAPIGYELMRRWLEDFAYRIKISWWVFALAGGLALVIALVTVSTQALKAALANPVDSLRYE